jgi:hypothetical protein
MPHDTLSVDSSSSSSQQSLSSSQQSLIGRSQALEQELDAIMNEDLGGTGNGSSGGGGSAAARMTSVVRREGGGGNGKMEDGDDDHHSDDDDDDDYDDDDYDEDGEEDDDDDEDDDEFGVVASVDPTGSVAAAKRAKRATRRGRKKVRMARQAKEKEESGGGFHPRPMATFVEKRILADLHMWRNGEGLISVIIRVVVFWNYSKPRNMFSLISSFPCSKHKRQPHTVFNQNSFSHIHTTTA